MVSDQREDEELGLMSYKSQRSKATASPRVKEGVGKGRQGVSFVSP